MIRTQGRGLKSGRVSIIPSATGLTIRIDDDERPEFWLTVEMNLAELEHWLALCRAAAEVEHPEWWKIVLSDNGTQPDVGGDK